MGTALITLKLMPSSPQTDLEKIKVEVIKIVEKEKGKNPRFEIEPIAFGLKALKVFFDLNEDYELEPIENSLAKIKDVNSVQVVDMRRAFG